MVPKDKVTKLLDRLIKDTTIIIASPSSINEMRGKGAKIHQEKKLTPKEKLDKLFQERRSNAEIQINLLPEFPDIGTPSVQTLYQEIQECILMGLNGAAITLSGILVEFALKVAIIRKESSVNNQIELWDFVETLDFGKSISKAKELRIIDENKANKLTRFKDDVRNPYNHYNLKKITRGFTAGKTKVVDIKTGKFEEKDLTAEENPQIWFVAKSFVDRKRVIEVFVFADSVVKDLLKPPI